MNKKAFTLVELLGVIIIIGIVGSLSIPPILSRIKANQTKIDELTTSILYSSSDLYFSSNANNYVLKEGKHYCVSLEELIRSGNLNSNLTYANGDPIPTDTYIKMTIFNNQYEYKILPYGNVCSSTKYLETELDGNDPVLSSGMLAVNINSDGKVFKTSQHKTWYSYANKKWANVVLLRSSNRDTYFESLDGTEISQEDIMAYLVWIPRYEYKINGFEEEISINFSNSDLSNTGYSIHPSFLFGIEKLSGYWVGKFETSSLEETCIDEETCLNVTPKIVPYVEPLVNQKISTQFLTSTKFTDNGYYGLGSTNDAHLMKNTEWGAIVYLSHSKYGINSNVETINCYIEDCIDYSVGKKNYPQSTTGNITGIFGMAGGVGEYVMAGYQNNIVDEDNLLYNQPMSGNDSDYNSGFTGIVYSGGIYSNYTGINLPNQKYYNLYNSTSIMGDATDEMSPSANITWYGDNAYYLNRDTNMWYVRGVGTSPANGIFSFDGTNSYGNASSNIGFRVVLLGK